MRTIMIKMMGRVLIPALILSGLALSFGLSLGADHTIPYPGLMPQVLWTRGCTPTSASMVLGYYDYDDGTGSNLGYGRLIDYWMDLSDYVDGRNGILGIQNVPFLLEELRVWMGTDGEGETYTTNIGPAIIGLTKHKGYSFDSGECQGASIWNDFCWEAIVGEINVGRPFLWSVGYSAEKGHTLAAWGYTDEKYVITHNTWEIGRDDWYYSCYDNGPYSVYQYVHSVVPGGAQGDNQLTLGTPTGGESLIGGQDFTVSWYQWGDLISNVDLSYSVDGGCNFVHYVDELPSVPGWNYYNMRVPNVDSHGFRLWVIGFDPSRGYWVPYGSNWIASDGTKKNSTITPDTTAPIGSITINSGAPYTTSTSVTLNLSASDSKSGVEEMCIADITSCGQWEPYATTKQRTLPGGDGTKTVYAWFKDRAGNFSMYSASIILDTTPPSGSITINNGDANTKSASVKLALSASDSNGVPQMCISNTTSCSSWVPYATSKSWTLSAGDGTKTVYATFKDSAGNLAVYSHSIVLDTTGPAGSVTINGAAPYTNSTSVTLTLSSSDATEMCIRNSTMVNCAFLWQPYATTKQWTLSGGDGTKVVYVTFSDGAGNLSPLYSDSINLDTSIPTGSVTINGDATYTNSPSVTLALSASDPGGVADMCIRNSSMVTCPALFWQPYATTKQWTLSGGNGTKTVYVLFRDGAGNLSPLYSDSIRFDTSIPTGSVTINGGATYTNSPSVALALSASDPSGVADMCIRNSTIFTCALLWQPYATTKQWTLPGGDGTKAVYVTFSDGSGNVSSLYSDQIILDATAPVDGTLSAVTGNGRVSLKWSGFSDAGSGVKTHTLVFGTNEPPPPCSSTRTKIYSGTGTSYLHKGLTNGTMYFYRVCATDNAGNTSSGITASATPGTSIISIPKISVIPTAYNFENVNVKRSKRASFVVKNSGKANLSITSTITGTDASMFTIKSGSGSKTIKPGKSLTVKVAFKPTSEGSKSANLEITSNDPFTPTINIPLSGTGQ